MERERTMRRVLSVLLAVLMLVTSVPMDTVYAEEANTSTSKDLTAAPNNLDEQDVEEGGYSENYNTSPQALSKNIVLGTESGGSVTLTVQKDGSDSTITATVKSGNSTEDKTKWDESSAVVYELDATGTDSNGDVVIEVLAGDTFIANAVPADSEGTKQITIEKDDLAKATASSSLSLKVVNLYSVTIDKSNPGANVKVSNEGVTEKTENAEVNGKYKAGSTVTVSATVTADEGYYLGADAVQFDGSATDVVNNDGTYSKEYTSLDAEKAVAITATATQKPTVTAEFDNANDDVESVTFSPVSFVPSTTDAVEVKLSGTVELTAAAQAANKTVTGVTFSSTTPSIADTELKLNEGKWEGTISVPVNKTDSFTGTLAVTTADVTYTVTYDGNGTNVKTIEVYDAEGKSLTTGNTVKAGSKIYVYAEPEDNYEIASVNESTKTNDTIVSGKTCYEVEVTGNITISVVAKKESCKVTIPTVADLNELAVYTSDGDEVQTGGTVEKGSTIYVYAVANAGKKITSVNGNTTPETVSDLENKSCYAVEAEGETLTISVVLEDVVTLTVTKDAGTASVSTEKDGDDIEYDLEVKKGDSVTLYLALTPTDDGAGNAYKFYSVKVTTGTGNKATTVDKVSSLLSATGKEEGTELVYKLNLGKLTDVTSVDVKTVKRTGHTIKFEGSNYIAQVGESGITYSENLPFIDEIGDGKTITLTANEGYRFKEDSVTLDEDDDTTITYTNSGKSVSISGVTAANFDDNKVLNVTAELEKTVTFTFDDEVSTYFEVEVKEDYNYHNNGIVAADDDGVYEIAANGTADLTLTFKNDYATKKLTAVTILADSLKDDENATPLNLEFSDETEKDATVSTYAISLKAEEAVKEASTISVTIADDEKKLLGIKFVKEHYTVKNDAADVIASFVDENGNELKEVLCFFKNLAEDDTELVLTITPEHGYQIDTIKYGTDTCYNANDEEDKVDGITAVVAEDTGVINLTIPVALVKAEGEQEALEVVTKAVKLTAEDLDGAEDFEITYAAVQKVTVNGDKTDVVFFDPAQELKYNVSGGVTKHVDENTGAVSYSLKANADYITFSVSGPSEVEASLTFVDEDGKALPVDRSGNTFKIAAKALLEVESIILDGEVSTEDIEISYNENLVALSAVSVTDDNANEYVKARSVYGSLVIAAEKDAEGNNKTDGSAIATYKVRKGKQLEVSVTAKGVTNDKGEITRYYAEITNAAGYPFTAEESSFILTANSAQKLQIVAKALVSKVVAGKKDVVVEAEDNGSYIVSYGAKYTAYVNEGHTTANVNKAELVIGSETTKVSVSGNVASFEFAKEAAGKTAVLNLQYEDAEKNVTTVASFDFVVSNALTEVTVSGVENGRLSQTIDTEVRYAISLPTGTSINDLDALPVGTAEIDAETQELVITTKAEAAKDNAATVELINNKDGKTLSKIIIDTKKVVGVEEAVPSVTAITSSVDSLMVKLAATGVADVDLHAGDIAYKVVVSKQSGSATPDHQNTFYIAKKGDAQEASLKILTDATANKNTKDNKYNVSVQLVQLSVKADSEGINKDKEIYKSKAVDKKDTDEFVIKAPYYTNADELLLTNQLTTVYTGQTAAIADVNFGSKTSYIEGAKVTLFDAKGNVIVIKGKAGSVEYNKLYVTIPTDLTLGNYTVEVEAPVPVGKDGKPTAVAATASMNIKVEAGVWKVELQNVPNTLLKLDKKDAKFKATVLFNENAKATVKNKKVAWYISSKAVTVDANGYPVITELGSNDYLNGRVTVKNGAVSVSKDYVVSPNASKNTFYLVAVSEANPSAYACMPVEITNKEVEIGDLLLAEAKYDDGDNFVGYAPLKDQTTVSSELAVSENLRLIVVKKGLQKSVYKLTDLMSSSLTVKQSNKKLAVSKAAEAYNTDYAAYKLYSATTMKTVKLTVTAMDGSKSSAQKAFVIDFANMDNMVMAINGEIVGASYNFVGTSEDTLTVELGYKGTDGFVNFTGLLNAKLAISGGKILSSDTVNNAYIVKLTKDKATINVSDKADKNKAPLSCVIANTAYTTVTAPTVTADVKQITANSVDAQQITYSLKKAGKAKAANYKFVKVQIDETDNLKLVKKGNRAYRSLLEAMGAYDKLENLQDIILPIEKDSFVLSFAANSAIPAGGYKLFFSYGDYDASGNFVPATKAGKATVKAVESKTADYTAATAYTMSLVDTAEVTLTGVAGKNTTVKYPDGNALSTIVDGKANNFGTFFTVKDGKLALKSYKDLNGIDKAIKTLEGLVGAESANDLTGYVQYRVNGSANLKQVKVTVKLSKDALKTYTSTPSPIAMLASDDVKVEASVLANGEAVKAVAAKVTNGSFDKQPVITEDGTLVLTSGNVTAGTNTATVAVVPSTSFYAAKDKVEADKYGVPVTVTVDAKSSFDKVITMDSLAVKFTDYDGEKGNYIAKIPYTSNIANEITKIKASNKDLASLVTFSADGEFIIATVNKAALDKAVEKETVSYGQTKSVEATVEYCDGLIKETYTFEVSFPSAASIDLKEVFTNIRKAVWGDLEDNPNGNPEKYFPGDIDFTEAVKIIQEALEAMKDNSFDRDELGALAAKFDEALSKAVVSAVETAVKEQLVVGADIALKSVTMNEYLTAADIVLTGNAVTAENVCDGDYESGDYILTTNIDTSKLVSEFGMYVYVNYLDDFASNVEEFVTANNSLTEDMIVDAARANVLADASSEYKIISSNFTKKEATSEAAGKVTLNLYVKNVSTKEVSDAVEVVIEIPQLQTVSAAIDHFNDNFTAYKTSYLDGFGVANANTTDAIIIEIAKSGIEDTNRITVAFKENEKDGDTNAFAQTKKTLEYKVEGEDEETEIVTGFVGILVFTDTSTGVTGEVDVTYNFNNLPTDTGKVLALSELKAKVLGVIGDNDKVKELFTNDSETSKAAILKAATQAIANAPYVVEINDWTFTAPTYEEAGLVSYVVEFKAMDSDLATTDTIRLNQEVPASVDYQSFDEAVAAIKENWSQKAFDESWRKDGKAETDEILKFIEESVADNHTDITDDRFLAVDYALVVNESYTAYEPSCKLVNETVNDDGSLTLTVVLREIKVIDEDNIEVLKTQEITLRKTINELSQTRAEAVNAVEDWAKTFVVSKTTTENDLTNAIREIIKVDDFKVRIDEFKNDKGKVTCKIFLYEDADELKNDTASKISFSRS